MMYYTNVLGILSEFTNYIFLKFWFNILAYLLIKRANGLNGNKQIMDLSHNGRDIACNWNYQ